MIRWFWLLSSMHFSSLLITLPHFLLIIFARVFPIWFHTPPATPAGTTRLSHATESLSIGFRPVFSMYNAIRRNTSRTRPDGGLPTIYCRFRLPVPIRFASSSSVHPVRFLMADTQSLIQNQYSGRFTIDLLIQIHLTFSVSSQFILKTKCMVTRRATPLLPTSSMQPNNVLWPPTLLRLCLSQLYSLFSPYL